ncbi:MAG TPA: hypothetical protein PK668_26240 [Myxococcota bacterium]|nr:hypothetical protein [Myxococcota bacterium]HRY97027.1 hypothetical protein [Myxococcota bacterium]HSA23810.1 hypothetical protein [Myxococcota bacterium]
MRFRGGWNLGLGALLALGLLGGCSDSTSASDDGGQDGVDGADDGGQDGGEGDLPDAADGADTTPGCGNGVAEENESCDGEDLRGQTCAGLGYTGGELACSECKLDRTGCASACDNDLCETGETATSCSADCGARDVACGTFHTCAVRNDGTLWCWGGEAGLQAGGMGRTSVPRPVPGITGASQVCAGEGHTCVLIGSGVRCFGRNGFGEAGQHPGQAFVFPPAVVPGLEQGVTGISCGRFHTCAKGDGKVTCWGRNDSGQAGAPRTVRLHTPVETAMPEVVGVATGGRHTCASSGVSAVYCWGYGAEGALGSGVGEWTTAPGASLLPDTNGQVGAGDRHACANRFSLGGEDPALYCWGANEYGQVGQPAGAPVLSPQLVQMPSASMVAGGAAHTCALRFHGVYCWGRNDAGQLGDGTTTSTHVPREIALDARSLSVGESHTCVVLRDDLTVRCWGSNLQHQLGIGSADRQSLIPVEPVGL